MEERSQGAVEYLLMLAAALVVVGSLVAMIRSLSTGMSGNVESDIESVKNSVIDILT